MGGGVLDFLDHQSRRLLCGHCASSRTRGTSASLSVSSSLNSDLPHGSVWEAGALCHLTSEEAGPRGAG